MKLKPVNSIIRGRGVCTRRAPTGPRRAERGSAVLIVLVFLAIMAAFSAINSATLRHLERELRLIETQQLQRIAPIEIGTPVSLLPDHGPGQPD